MIEIVIKIRDVITVTGSIMTTNSAVKSVTGDMMSVTTTEEETIMTTTATEDRTELTETVVMTATMINDAIEMRITDEMSETEEREMMMSDEMTDETEMMIDDEMTEMMNLTDDVKTETGDRTTIAMMTGTTDENKLLVVARETETRISDENSEIGEIVTATLTSLGRTETGEEIRIEMMREDERTETEEIVREMMNDDRTEMVPNVRTEMLKPAERGERETLTTLETTTTETSTETMLRSDEISITPSSMPGSMLESSLTDREMMPRTEMS